MEGYVGELDTGCGGRRLERGCVARDAVRIGVDDASSDLVGIKRGPTNARSSYFREGRGRRERRRPRRKNTIDIEILPPRCPRDVERSADEDGLVAACVDEKLTLDPQRPVDDQRRDRSIFLALDDSCLRLVYFDPESRRERLKIAYIGQRLHVIAIVGPAKCQSGVVREQHATVFRGHGCEAKILIGDVQAATRRLEPAREKCTPIDGCPICPPSMKEVGGRAYA